VREPEFIGIPEKPAFQPESSEHAASAAKRLKKIRTGMSRVLSHLRENSLRPRLSCHRMIIFDILTLFPRLCEGAFAESILKKAQENLLISVRCLNIRDWATDKHHITDEPPYGGGPGMVMKPDPIFSAVESIRHAKSHVIVMGPGGRRFNQQVAVELSRKEHLILVCGHYEGIDYRVTEHLADDEISIGDYVLTNGAIAAAVVVDAVARLIPGVLGDGESACDESFSSKRLEYPQYTRPFDFRGWCVPEILLSGNHASIRRWREERALEKTRAKRPDLLDDA
jgi:tRNA (guanine37-N1)-methyltransferase